MGKIVFITGGARSGKTSYALGRAMQHEAQRLYIATAEPLDQEMHRRIEAHKEEREGMGFDTLETPVDIAGALVGLGDISQKYGAVLIDCLTLWLSNMMGREMDIKAGAKGLIDELKKLDCPVYIVTNEVGLGIVPENEMARAFRDSAGMVNAMMAKEADEAWMLVSGLPVKIK